MNTIELIAKHLDKKVLGEPEEVDTICAFTGQKINEGFKLKDALSSSFTDYEYIKYKSEYVSVELALLLSGKIINGKAGLRNYSFLATENELKIFKTEEVWRALFEEKETPFMLCVTFNGKKHTSFKAKLNYNNTDFVIQTDLAPVRIYMPDVNEVFPIIQNRYSVIPEKKETSMKPTFFTKEEIEFGCSNFKKIEQYGAEKFFSEEKILNKYRGSMFLKLLTFVVRKND